MPYLASCRVSQHRFLFIWAASAAVIAFLWFRYKDQGGYDVVRVPGTSESSSAQFPVATPTSGANQYDQL